MRAARQRLDAACEAIGRDPATLELSIMARVVVGTDEAEYGRRLAAVQRKALEPPDEVDDGSWVAGTPAQAIERIAAFRAAGVERFFLNHFDHRDLEMVELVATDVLPARAMTAAPTLGDVQVAAATIAAGVVRTPLVRAEALDEIAGAPVWLKAELLQHTGSFKLRGALNRMQALSAAERAAGVVTVSAGNHAAAVARAGVLSRHRRAGADAARRQRDQGRRDARLRRDGRPDVRRRHRGVRADDRGRRARPGAS